MANPANLLNVAADADASTVVLLDVIDRTLQSFASQHLDEVFIIYVGHGIAQDGRLFLAVSSTREGLEAATAIPFDLLMSLVDRRLDPVRRVYLILDCCHAGLAVARALRTGTIYRSPREVSEEDAAGVALAFSCGPEEALPVSTNFLGLPMSSLLCEAIASGIPRAPAFLSLSDMITFSRQEIRRRPWHFGGDSSDLFKRYPGVVNVRLVRGDPSGARLVFNRHSFDLLPRIERILTEYERGSALAAAWLAKLFDANPLTSAGGDLERAFFWFSEAARLGDAEAQYKLGWFYKSGWVPGVPQDCEASRRWYLESVRQGQLDALLDLFLYHNATFHEEKLELPQEWRERMERLRTEIAQVSQEGLETRHYCS
jgi:hypothetical protein